MTACRRVARRYWIAALLLVAVAAAAGASVGLQSCDRPPARMTGWANCDKAHVTLPGVDLRGADLVGANLTGADLRGADFSRGKYESDDSVARSLRRSHRLARRLHAAGRCHGRTDAVIP